MSHELIDRLCEDLSPVRRGAVARRLGAGLAVGVLVSTMLMLFVLGLRPDLAHASATDIFWIKGAYALALACIGIWSAERLARPACEAQQRLAWLVAPLAAVMVLAVVQLATAPPQLRGPMIFGSSANECPWFIMLLSVPPFVGLVWAMRGLAPTRLLLAGAVSGLAAGGAGSFVFAFHCTESTAPFLAIWYTLGVVGVGLAGSLLGPRILRWR